MIVKCEADYNMLIKLYWPRLTTRYAERIKCLGKNQLETRLDKNSNDPCIIDELLLENSRIQHTVLLVKKNKELACYDRMIPSHISINSQRE